MPITAPIEVGKAYDWRGWPVVVEKLTRRPRVLYFRPIRKLPNGLHLEPVVVRTHVDPAQLAELPIGDRYRTQYRYAEVTRTIGSSNPPGVTLAHAKKKATRGRKL